MNKESSDEKLLKLIEGTSKVSHMPSIGVMRKKKSLGRAFALFKLKPRVTLFNINKVLFVISMLLTMVFFYNFIAGTRYAASGFLLDSVKNISSFTKPKPDINKGVLTIQEYLDSLDRRNVFLTTGFSQKKAIDTIVVTDLVKDLKLVGIIWSNNPEAMIENAVEGKTYLLKKDEKFSQDRFKIKDITRSSAILDITVEDQHIEYELR